MSATIWKYQLRIQGGHQTKRIPSGASVIEIAAQNDLPCVWALVDTDSPLVERTFVVRGTGQWIEDNETYLGTCHTPPLVWHVFEVIGD